MIYGAIWTLILISVTLRLGNKIQNQEKTSLTKKKEKTKKKTMVKFKTNL